MTCAPFLNLFGEGELFYFRLLSTHDELFCFEVKLFARSERWPFMLWIGFTCNLDSDFMITMKSFPRRRRRASRLFGSKIQSETQANRILGMFAHEAIHMKWNLLFTFTVFQFVPS